MVQVAEVEDLQVEGAGPGVGPAADGVDDLGRRAGQAVRAKVLQWPPDGRGAAGHLRLVLAAAHRLGGREPDRGRVPPSFHAGLPNPAERLRRVRQALERQVVLVREPGRQPRRAPGAGAAQDDRRLRLLGRLGQRGRVGQLVVGAAEGKRLARRGRPEPGDDRELLLEPVEPFLQARERDPVRRVLLLEPPGTEAEFDAAAAHLVDLGHRDSQRPGQPEGGRGHHGAKPDAARLQGEAAQRHPGVRRAGQAGSVAHGQEMI